MKFLRKGAIHLWIALICGVFSILYITIVILDISNIISWGDVLVGNIVWLWLWMLSIAITIFASSYGLLRKIPKHIHSWIALICGIFSFLWLVHFILDDLDIIVYSVRTWKVKHWLESIAWLAMVATTVAVFSGGYGLVGKVVKATRVRSLVGLIFGILFWLIMLPMWFFAFLD
jgi:hypothetical protein